MRRAILASLALATAGCQTDEAGRWSAPVRLGDAGQLSTGRLVSAGARASLAVAPPGLGAILWERQGADGSEIWASRFAPASGWSAARRIQGPDALPYAYEAQVALDGQGDGFAAWLEQDATGTRLRVARTTPAGFDAPIELARTTEATEPTESFPRKDLVIEPGGNALLAWRAESAIHAWHRRAGAEWSAPATFDPRVTVRNAIGAGTPYVSAGGEVGLLAWHESLFANPRPRAIPFSQQLDFASGVWRDGDVPLADHVLFDAAGGRLLVTRPPGLFPISGFRYEPSSGWQRPVETVGGLDAVFIGPAGRPDGQAIVVLTRVNLGSGTPVDVSARRFVPAQGWTAGEPLSVTFGRPSALVMDPAGRVSFLQGRSPGLYLSGSTGPGTWTTGVVPALPNDVIPDQCGSTSAEPAPIAPVLAVDSEGVLTLVRPAWDCRTTTLWAQRRRPGTL